MTIFCQDHCFCLPVIDSINQWWFSASSIQNTFNFQLATFNILESIEKASTDALLLRSSTLELGLVEEGS